MIPETPEILNTEIIHQNGSFMRVRRWLKGAWPKRGKLTCGWTGMETIEEVDFIRPIGHYTVMEVSQFPHREAKDAT